MRELLALLKRYAVIAIILALVFLWISWNAGPGVMPGRGF